MQEGAMSDKQPYQTAAIVKCPKCPGAQFEAPGKKCTACNGSG